MIAGDERFGMERVPDEAQSWAQMSRWFQDERLLEYYGGRSHRYSPEEVRRHYRPYVVAPTHGMVAAFLILEHSRIGYIQLYHAQPEDYQMREYPAHDIWAMDLFIGQPELWGRGYGQRYVHLALAHLFEHSQAREVWIDPHCTNVRAIRTYERCGFTRYKVLKRHEEHDGVMCDAWLMRCDQEVWHHAR